MKRKVLYNVVNQDGENKATEGSYDNSNMR